MTYQRSILVRGGLEAASVPLARNRWSAMGLYFGRTGLSRVPGQITDQQIGDSPIPENRPVDYASKHPTVSDSASTAPTVGSSEKGIEWRLLVSSRLQALFPTEQLMVSTRSQSVLVGAGVKSVAFVSLGRPLS